MRVVVYDDESLEPITVVELKGMTDRDITARRHWLVPVPPQLPVSYDPSPVSCELMTPPVVQLDFEPFVRVSRRHGEQHAWFCFTNATELALLLEPTWLPGQRSAVEQLQQGSHKLIAAMLMTMLRGKLR